MFLSPLIWTQNTPNWELMKYESGGSAQFGVERRNLPGVRFLGRVRLSVSSGEVDSPSHKVEMLAYPLVTQLLPSLIGSSTHLLNIVGVYTPTTPQTLGV